VCAKRINGKDRLCVQGGHIKWIFGVFKINTWNGNTVVNLMNSSR